MHAPVDGRQPEISRPRFGETPVLLELRSRFCYLLFIMEPLDVGRIAYQIDVANALIAIQLLGPVTPAQMEDFMLRIEDTPEYDLDQDGLIDLRDYNGQLEVEDLRRIAQFVRERPGNPGARRAIIVKDDLQFGLMRMMESLTSLAPVIYRAFRTEIAARNWLDERKNVLRTTASPALEA